MNTFLEEEKNDIRVILEVNSYTANRSFFPCGPLYCCDFSLPAKSTKFSRTACASNSSCACCLALFFDELDNVALFARFNAEFPRLDPNDKRVAVDCGISIRLIFTVNIACEREDR